VWCFFAPPKDELTNDLIFCKAAVLMVAIQPEREISLMSGGSLRCAPKGVDAHQFDPAAEAGTSEFSTVLRCFISPYGRFGEDGTVVRTEKAGYSHTGRHGLEHGHRR
jgi:hypothetical protein